MAITLEFPASHSKKARNSTKRLPTASQVDVIIKDATSISHPTFEIHCPSNNGIIGGVNLFNVPCCYCSAFSRWYWITNVEHVTTCVFNITCETDVLATFRNEIGDTVAFVEYSTSNGSFMQDTRFPRTYESKLLSNKLKLNDFNTTGCYILQVATTQTSGSNGLLETYALAPSALKKIAQKLYATDLIGKITNTFSDPTTALGNCTWIPLKPNKAQGALTQIKFNDVSLGSGKRAKKTYSKFLGSIRIPDLHHGTYVDANGNKVQSWADYRNFPPYTEYYIYLPGVGLVEYPFQECFNSPTSQPSLGVNIYMSIPTGDVMYTLRPTTASGTSPEKTVMTVTGKLGYNVPTSSYQTGIGGAISSGIALGASLTTMAIAPQSIPFMAGTAINSGASTLLNAGKSSMSATGSMGSTLTSISSLMQVIGVALQYGTTDTPWSAAESMGLPLFKHIALKNLSGYVKCRNAFVNAWGSADELDRINAYLNGEGVLLED